MFFVSIAAAVCAYKPYRTADGLAVRWPSDRVIVVHAGASPDAAFAADAVVAALGTAFDTWLVDTTCPSADPPRRDTRPEAPEIVATNGVLDEGDGVVSLAWFSDVAVWNQRFGQLELARTILIHRRTSGEIVDADIAVNLGGFDFTLDSACDPSRYDFMAMLTHEVGHVLGLDHSDVPSATMARRSEPGECDKRTLDPDDIAGICATYSVVAPEPVPEPVPEVSVETSSAELTELPAERDDGCHGGSSRWVGWLAAFVLFVGQRRRREQGPVAGGLSQV